MVVFEFATFWVALSFVIVVFLIVLKGKNALLKASYDKIDRLKSRLDEVETILSDSQKVVVDLDNEYAKLNKDVDEKLKVVHDSAAKLKNSIDEDLVNLVNKLEKDFDLREKGFRRSVIDTMYAEVFDALSKKIVNDYKSGNVVDNIDVSSIRNISVK